MRKEIPIYKNIRMVIIISIATCCLYPVVRPLAKPVLWIDLPARAKPGFGCQTEVRLTGSKIGIDLKTRCHQSYWGTYTIQKPSKDLKVLFRYNDSHQEDPYYNYISKFRNKNIDVVYIVADATDRNTFKNIVKLVGSINKLPNVIKILVLNKVDTKYPAVTTSQAKDVAESIGAYFIEISALPGKNINRLLTYTLDIIDPLVLPN